MEWLAENWFWLLVFLAFIGMHLGHGHGGHGGHGHGGRGGHDAHEDGESGRHRKAGSDRGDHHAGH